MCFPFKVGEFPQCHVSENLGQKTRRVVFHMKVSTLWDECVREKKDPVNLETPSLNIDFFCFWKSQILKIFPGCTCYPLASFASLPYGGYPWWQIPSLVMPRRSFSCWCYQIWQLNASGDPWIEYWHHNVLLVHSWLCTLGPWSDGWWVWSLCCMVCSFVFFLLFRRCDCNE